MNEAGTDALAIREPEAVRWHHEPTTSRARAVGARTINDSIPAARGDAEIRAAVSAVVAGDVEAFRIIVERGRPTILGACVRVLGDLGEAEDVAQETFVIAYRSLGTWRGEGPLEAWLARIAIRIALRRVAARRTVGWAEPIAETAEPLGAGAATLQSGADPVAIALRSERDRAVRRAVSRLEDPYREVVGLRFFGDLSLAEIADATGRPVPTIKTQLRRGLVRLKAVLDTAGVGV